MLRKVPELARLLEAMRAPDESVDLRDYDQEVVVHAKRRVGDDWVRVAHKVPLNQPATPELATRVWSEVRYKLNQEVRLKKQANLAAHYGGSQWTTEQMANLVKHNSRVVDLRRNDHLDQKVYEILAGKQRVLNEAQSAMLDTISGATKTMRGMPLGEIKRMWADYARPKIPNRRKLLLL